MDYTEILYERRGRVAIVTLNRPDKLNALSRVMQHEYKTAFEEANRDDSVGAIVLTGAGRAFSSGADMADFERFRKMQEAGEPLPFTSEEPWHQLLRRIGKPIIAAINGLAIGQGASMLLSLDFRLMSETARVAFMFVRIGVTPEAGSSNLLPRMIGMTRATDWCFTGRQVPADEAYAAGFATAVHPPERLLDAAVELGEHLAGSSPLAIQYTRNLLRENPYERDLDAVIRHEHDAFETCRASWQHEEAIAAFREKRPADFTRRPPAADA
jgi:enoyl-CoA hydratase/carnithine racemase